MIVMPPTIRCGCNSDIYMLIPCLDSALITGPMVTVEGLAYAIRMVIVIPRYVTFSFTTPPQTQLGVRFGGGTVGEVLSVNTAVYGTHTVPLKLYSNHQLYYGGIEDLDPRPQIATGKYYDSTQFDPPSACVGTSPGVISWETLLGWFQYRIRLGIYDDGTQSIDDIEGTVIHEIVENYDYEEISRDNWLGSFTGVNLESFQDTETETDPNDNLIFAGIYQAGALEGWLNASSGTTPLATDGASPFSVPSTQVALCVLQPGYVDIEPLNQSFRACGDLSTGTNKVFYGGEARAIMGDPVSACPGGASIFTHTNLAAYVGQAVKLVDNVWYFVAPAPAGSTSDGTVTVTDTKDSCMDACNG